MKAKILIVDDDPANLEALNEAYLDTYDVILAATGAEALDKVRCHADIAAIVLDIRMAKMNGFETARQIKCLGCDAPIVFNTGYPGDYSREQVTQEHQPFDYVGKNEGPLRLQRAVTDAVESTRLRTDREYLIHHALDNFGMVGRSESMLTVFRTIEQISRSDSKVMIFGETGTGKGMAAEAIHKRSLRAKQEFRTYSCSQKSTDLVESELFGHIKGSFTGAIADRVGLFEIAHLGTVFLDEIADLDLSTQTKLLRVLETGEIQRLGSALIRTVDVRTICATNRNLRKAVDEGRFREDLFFRLKGIILDMPPLRERREDILNLVDYHTDRYCTRRNLERKFFEQEARDLFVEYDWPGNVRELEICVHSLIDSTPSYLITRGEVLQTLKFTPQPVPSDGAFADQVREFKRILIIKGLDRHRNNVAKLARDFQMDPANLRKTISQLGISIG